MQKGVAIRKRGSAITRGPRRGLVDALAGRKHHREGGRDDIVEQDGVPKAVPRRTEI